MASDTIEAHKLTSTILARMSDNTVIEAAAPTGPVGAAVLQLHEPGACAVTLVFANVWQRRRFLRTVTAAWGEEAAWLDQHEASQRAKPKKAGEPV
jgi:hypothetical protein